MKEIQLNKEKVAFVDDEDFERLNEFKWIAWKRPNQEKWYALKDSRREKYETSADRKMEHHIIDVPCGLMVDHKNGNGLDNRKENLRIATYQENAFNRKKASSKTTSRFKGVTRKGNKWQASIGVDRKTIYLGRYDNEESAAAAYDKKATELHGQYASLNFQP